MVTIITQSEKVNGLSPGSLYFYNKHSGAGVGGSGGGGERWNILFKLDFFLYLSIFLL